MAKIIQKMTHPSILIIFYEIESSVCVFDWKKILSFSIDDQIFDANFLCSSLCGVVRSDRNFLHLKPEASWSGSRPEPTRSLVHKRSLEYRVRASKA